MVNIIREGWCRTWKELCVLLSCNVILLGAVGTLKIPSWGGSETGVVSVLPPQGCQKGRLNVLLLLLLLLFLFGVFLVFGFVFFFLFQRLKLTSDMQSGVRKCLGCKECFWLVKKFRVVGGDVDWVSGTPVSALSPSQGCPCIIQILGML